MGSIGWIHTEDCSLDCMPKMERFRIRLVTDSLNKQTKAMTAVALRANPKAACVFEQKSPENTERIKRLAAKAPDGLSTKQVRAADGCRMSRAISAWKPDRTRSCRLTGGKSLPLRAPLAK